MKQGPLGHKGSVTCPSGPHLSLGPLQVGGEFIVVFCATVPGRVIKPGTGIWAQGHNTTFRFQNIKDVSSHSTNLKKNNQLRVVHDKEINIVNKK